MYLWKQLILIKIDKLIIYRKADIKNTTNISYFILEIINKNC